VSAPSFETPTSLIASTLFERVPNADGASSVDGTLENQVLAPARPDDLDPAILQREVAHAYYAKRNELILKQHGGFLRESDRGAGPDGLAEFEGELDSEGFLIGDGDGGVPIQHGSEDGDWDEDAQPVKRVSRFKAARLRATQASFQ